MSEKTDFATHLSLIDRMMDSRYRSGAWKMFVERYIRLFYAWFKEWNIDPFSMDDVLQDTLIRVLRDLNGFEHRRHGSFRAWLKALARNSWLQVLEDKERQLSQREADPSHSRHWGLIRSKLAEESLILKFDAWATEELLCLAESRVRQRVDDRTWDTYRRLVHENQAVEEVRSALGIEPGQVYSRLFRVRRMIREEMERLEGPKDLASLR